MKFRKSTWIFIAAVMLVSFGCASTSDIAGPGDLDSKPVEGTNLDAEYRLISVDGSPVPGTISHDGMEIEMYSGRFKFKPDGRCFTETIFAPPGGSKMTRLVKATYSRNDSGLVMRWEGAGTTTGSIDGDRFTMDNHGMIFLYQKLSGQQ